MRLGLVAFAQPPFGVSPGRIEVAQANRLQAEGVVVVLERLFPGEVIVTSDEDSDDELTEDQLEVLEAIYERTLEERYAWPAPSL